ncbi:Conserved_hypothetical protein [Hexamita inflata]|uniref:Uncharacterized protein n=1 Tax=Hexamita inflata TaxID=28002 RepID=A0AA86UGG6_9EUKA|nr:Conserved hypothetical protein [Hexamita inflata]
MFSASKCKHIRLIPSLNSDQIPNLNKQPNTPSPLFPDRSQTTSTPHMQTTHTKAFAPKTKWSDEEVKTFFALYPRFGADFKQYVPHLNRTYSQIKGFYHNYLRRHGTEQKREADSPAQSFKAREHHQPRPVQNQKPQFSQETALLLDSLMDIMLNLKLE